MKLNKEDQTETIEVRLTEDKYPIAFRNKLEEIMEQHAFVTEKDARLWLEQNPIVLEVYYEKDAGLFAVESEALASCPETIRSPYSGEYFTE